MARMIPATIPGHTESNAERALFPLLRDGLDDSFTVFHSFDLLTRNIQGKFIDGEIDYLIFSPTRGFLVLEVKGGPIRYDGAAGVWYQHDRPLPKSPFAQARASKYELREYLASRMGLVPDVIFGHAACFPDVFSDMGNLPSGADPEICITGRELPSIHESIVSAMDAFKKGRAKSLSSKDVERIRWVLMPHCEYGIRLADRIEQSQQIIFALTENQCQVLDFISRHRRALIEGCAGSGKTVMAVKKARELGAAGSTVLLLAYNRLIGEYLSKEIGDTKNVTASTYHKFCMDTLREAGRLPPHRNDQDYWRKDIPEAFAELIRDHPMKYDAVIVDEGQDFHVEYWVTVEEMIEPNGHFYIFYDPAQNLYKTEMEFPIAGEPFVLVDNCRNSRAIFNALRPHAATEMRLKEGAPEGEDVVEFSSSSGADRRRQLSRILHDLVNNHSLDRSQIVILGGHSLGKTCVGDDPHIGNFKITEGDEDEPGGIHYHTYMKFKGCEADAVILLDVDPNDERWSDPAALYTTVSRARHLLYVLRVG